MRTVDIIKPAADLRELDLQDISTLLTALEPLHANMHNLGEVFGCDVTAKDVRAIRAILDNIRAIHWCSDDCSRHVYRLCIDKILNTMSEPLARCSFVKWGGTQD